MSTAARNPGPAILVIALALVFSQSAHGQKKKQISVTPEIPPTLIPLDTPDFWANARMELVPGDGGYVPIRVTLTPNGTQPVPPVVDQVISLEVEGRDEFRYRHRFIVRQDLTLPADSNKPVSTTLLVPALALSDDANINVLRGNDLLGSLDIDRLSPRRPGNMPRDTSVPTVLLIAEGPELRDNLVKTESRSSRNDRPYFVQAFDATRRNELTHAILNAAPSQFERIKHWIELSSIDIILLTYGELRDLKQQSPQAAQALREWTAAGGNLLVYDMQRTPQQFGELNELLGLQNTDPPTMAGWTIPVLPDDKIPTYVPLGPPQSRRRQIEKDFVISGELQGGPQSKSELEQSPEYKRNPPFLMRSLGGGMVVAIMQPKIDQLPSPGWPHLLGTLGYGRLQWALRNGVSSSGNVDDFENFLIPGVGETPVAAFTLLITAFVIVVGPVNYFFLRRSKRLHLLMLTVPAIAIVATLGLVGYMLLSEGFGVQLRARTVTLLDQPRGEAASWARLSYFAATGGRELSFDENTLVLPIYNDPPDWMYREVQRGTQQVRWDDDGQHWDATWLPARTPTQFMTSRVAKSTAQLVVRESPDSPPKVENRLGTRVRRLIVCDSLGKKFAGGELPAGGQATLSADGVATAELELVRELQMDDAPLTNVAQPQFRGRRRFRMPNRGTSEFAFNADSDHSVLARTLQELRKMDFAAEGLLGPQSYVALVDHSPDVAYGLDSAREEASLHVIVGRW